MPNKPPYVCGPCGKRVPAGQRCPCQVQHRRDSKARYDRNRPGARQRGYDTTWQRQAKAFLARPENRLCVCGCGRAADTVDHKIPHRGNKRLFWDRSNWQPMYRNCHSSKKQSMEHRA